ncbi:nuclear speckle splicing regulatory protein 1-like [Heracleum sosnowskyi]|uniref:Nuclear speckle splicing regulatory protein 1-like n=1 Tax=Heracleum sosnowskyi TaxID=360622 RepID=A0AAD8N3C7_9APIA|nr:nuclear speckle splicing regulatory protein 1-like [Heracleum sosnowskyi]
MSKYGLQIRVKPSSSAQPKATRPPRPPPSAFLDDEDDDVERDISRQASKNKSNKDYEELHKKALEEDPMAFEYDGVFDDMKQAAVRKTTQDKQKREPKYIKAIMEKTKAREREQEIVYERKLAKERSKDEHQFQDKEKFVTGAYKRKLAEQAKWVEEERLRELREHKEDITKTGDMSEFYFNLSRNVAFGAGEAELRREQERIQTTSEEERIRTSESSHPSTKIGSDSVAAQPDEGLRTPIAESSRDKVASEQVAGTFLGSEESQGSGGFTLGLQFFLQASETMGCTA